MLQNKLVANMRCLLVAVSIQLIVSTLIESTHSGEAGTKILHCQTAIFYKVLKIAVRPCLRPAGQWETVLIVLDRSCDIKDKPV